MAPHSRSAAAWSVLALGLVTLMLAGCAPALVPLPQLVAAWPAPSATLGRAPNRLELTFNRTLLAEASSVRLARTTDDWQPSSELAVDRNRLAVQLGEQLAPGTYAVQWRAVGARGQGTAQGEYAFVVSGERGPSPQLSVSQPETDAGQVIEVRGQGWRAQQDVQLAIGDEAVPLGTAHADQHGNFSVDARVPEQIAFGVQPVIATDGDQQPQAASAVRVHWGGWPPLAAWTTGTAGPQPGEVTFSISLRNRSDYLLEAVRVELPVPTGTSVVATDGDARLADGVLVWELPSLDRGAAGPLRVILRAPHAVATHATIAFRHRRPHDCSGEECLTAFVSQTVSDSAPVAPESP